MLAVLCIRLFDFQGGTKGSALCGVFSPSTPPWSDLVLLCAAALRYSSSMFQVPLWMFTKACVHPLWSSRALPSSFRCCLPAPCLLPLCWCPCVVSRSAPPCAALSPGSCRPPYFFSLSFGLSLSPCLFSCFASCGDGVILGSVLNLFLPFWVPLTYRGSRRPPSVSAAPSVFLFFLSGLLCVSFFFVRCGAPFLVLSWGFNWGRRTRL